MQNVDIVLRHYNKLKPINCSVISGDTNKLFTVKLTDNDSFSANMLKGDPVLIGVLNSDDTLQINGGSVVGATPHEDMYIICTNDVINMDKQLEKRQYERYPASLLGDIKLINTHKREKAFVKDYSYAGMCIYSTAELNINDTIEIIIYLSNNVSTYDATVMRKTKNYGRNEYGIQIIHRDKNAMYSTQSLLSGIMQSEKDLLYKHLISANFNKYDT